MLFFNITVQYNTNSYNLMNLAITICSFAPPVWYESMLQLYYSTLNFPLIGEVVHV